MSVLAKAAAMAEDWESMIVWDRMEVDKEFTDRVQQSQFSRQEWGMIMTAVDLRIEGTGRSAELVADTSKIEQILPELEKVNQQMPHAGGGGTRRTSAVIDSIKSALGIGGGVDEAALTEATSLVDEYAVTLQAHLEETGKWREVRQSVD